MNSLKRLIAWSVLLFINSAFAQSSSLAQFDDFDLPKNAKRLALVVWAESYSPLTEVENALNDGERIARVFYELGFDFVREIRDVTTPHKLYDALNEMKAQIASSQRPVEVVFFYAGHGFQIDGDNYLVTTSASNNSTADLLEGSVSLTEIGRRLQPEGKASMVLMFIDACRTVRYLEDGSEKEDSLMEDLKPGFHEGKFLARALVSMAAAPGKAARSVSRYEPKQNSPYTAALAPRLKKEGISLAGLLGGISSQVAQDTGEAQEPTFFSGPYTTEAFFFVPGQKQLDLDKRAWQQVLANPTNITSCAQDYIKWYPTGQFALQAEYLLSLPGKAGPYCDVKVVKMEDT